MTASVGDTREGTRRSRNARPHVAADSKRSRGSRALALLTTVSRRFRALSVGEGATSREYAPVAAYRSSTPRL